MHIIASYSVSLPSDICIQFDIELVILNTFVAYLDSNQISFRIVGLSDLIFSPIPTQAIERDILCHYLRMMYHSKRVIYVIITSKPSGSSITPCFSTVVSRKDTFHLWQLLFSRNFHHVLGLSQI